ncbi:uncharacterized protein DUF2553 [Melghirimyces profundicolus]|uniref:Uncharacterized protein DUF2553 n=1 Tax=Melghirimyces profundicolus TaxID=1242148 RepID=A0A2T6BW92_9BACL|nr:DUF2553 family protein [Melghirimyces profundicolus]PTX60341.1 uncharacterized protein DUF2553 [Melghirimyces profundicolus]
MSDNITSKVIGRLKKDKIVFYYEDDVIGEARVDLTKMDLKSGFQLRNQDIYSVTGRPRKPLDTHYAHNCDMGWC